MKRRIKALVLAVVLTMATLVTGCGAQTLEDYYNNESVKAQVEAQYAELLDQYSNIFSDMTMEITGNDMYYNYTYVEGIAVDPDMITADDATMQAVMDGVEQEAKIRPTSLTYNYYDYEGNLIKSLTFK